MELDLTLLKNTYLKDDPISFMQLNTKVPNKTITFTPNLSEEALLLEYKKYQDEVKAIFPLKEKMNKKYIKQVTSIINKFPQSFKKKQDGLIKALFIFDYIEANKKDIDTYNHMLQDKCNSIEKEIILRFTIELEKKEIEKKKFEGYPKVIKDIGIEINKLKREMKKELRENGEKFKGKFAKYSKMDPSKYKDSIFHDIALLLGEQPKQCTKIYGHIHKFIKNKISIA